MNAKILKCAAIVLVAVAILAWLREDGVYDFDLRTIIPFMHGERGVYDLGGIALLGLGWWGVMRLRHRSAPREDVDEQDFAQNEYVPPLVSHSDRFDHWSR